jgi:transcriptional regulator with XRE-family HTH domain
VSNGDSVRGDIRQFLTTRRARLTPQQAGLPYYGSRRRVSGLRREEVATLAGISIEYYSRLERGNVRGVSEEVLASIAGALQLDDVERAHLNELVRTASTAPAKRRRPDQPVVRRSVQQLLDSMTGAAAFVRNARLDILSANDLGYALYSQAFDDPTRPTNLARFVFLSAGAAGFYRDWDGIARHAVGSLRAETGRNPSDRELAELVDELSFGSEQFRSLWAVHDVTYYRSGIQPFRHPIVGDIDLDYDALEIATDPGLTIVAYTAAPDSEASKALCLLGNRLSPQQADPAAVDNLGKS